MNVCDSFLQNGIKATENVDTSKISSIRAGGYAKYGIYPDNIGNLIKAVKICLLLDLRYKIIGGCTNTFFMDGLYDGVVIFTKNITHTEKHGEYILAECGCPLARLLKGAAEYDLEISNALFGIPGTVGGAIRNNAGAFGDEICESFIEGLFINTDTLEAVTLNKEDLKFSYRSSLLMNEPLIFLRGKFATKRKKKNLCIEEFEKYAAIRKATQPNLPSLGSFFKRCGDVIPAELIDRAGLKDFCINDAAVSNKHSGFIVNLGGASASDIDELASRVENSIKSIYGVQLIREAELVI